MSTEQSKSVPATITETKAAPAAVTAPQVETKVAPATDTTQQATTLAASTKRVKNPKRVAAGKMVAERSCLAREEQKKAAEAYYAENQAKASTSAPKPAASTEGESPKSGGLFGLSTNQWIGIGGIGVSLGGLYYKREEIMGMVNSALDKIRTPKPEPEPTPKPASVDPKPASNARPRGLKKDLNICA